MNNQYNHSCWLICIEGIFHVWFTYSAAVTGVLLPPGMACIQAAIWFYTSKRRLSTRFCWVSGPNWPHPPAFQRLLQKTQAQNPKANCIHYRVATIFSADFMESFSSVVSIIGVICLLVRTIITQFIAHFALKLNANDNATHRAFVVSISIMVKPPTICMKMTLCLMQPNLLWNIKVAKPAFFMVIPHLKMLWTRG